MSGHDKCTFFLKKCVNRNFFMGFDSDKHTLIGDKNVGITKIRETKLKTLRRAEIHFWCPDMIIPTFSKNQIFQDVQSISDKKRSIIICFYNVPGQFRVKSMLSVPHLWALWCLDMMSGHDIDSISEDGLSPLTHETHEDYNFIALKHNLLILVAFNISLDPSMPPGLFDLDTLIVNSRHQRGGTCS